MLLRLQPNDQSSFVLPEINRIYSFSKLRGTAAKGKMNIDRVEWLRINSSG